MPKHKSEDFKISAVEYHLTEDISTGHSNQEQINVFNQYAYDIAEKRGILTEINDNLDIYKSRSDFLSFLQGIKPKSPSKQFQSQYASAVKVFGNEDLVKGVLPYILPITLKPPKGKRKKNGGKRKTKRNMANHHRRTAKK
jgi:hypothetical protein